MYKKCGFLESARNTRLYVTKWLPEGPAKAAVQFIHGLGESSGCYGEWASLFTQRGIAVVCADLRGHGRTSGKRGVVDEYGLLLDDAECLRNALLGEFPGLPLVLYGHSLGGNIALNFMLCRDPSAYACAVVSAPWLEQRRKPGAVFSGAAHLVGRLMPGYTAVTAISPEDLSHDLEALVRAKREGICHRQIGLRTLEEVLDAGRYALENASLLSVPTLLIQGTGDRVISVPAVERFASAAREETLTYVRFPGQYHELHNEYDREATFETVLNYLSWFIDPRTTGPDKGEAECIRR